MKQKPRERAGRSTNSHKGDNGYRNTSMKQIITFIMVAASVIKKQLILKKILK